MTYFTYIIYSDTYNLYYKGYTTNPAKRLEYHNNNRSRYTSGKGPWKLVFLQAFNTKSEALKREKTLKKANSKYIQWVIKQEYNICNNI